MASPDRSKGKTLKQVEILNKSRHVEALKTEAAGSNARSGNQNFSPSVITSKCRYSENGASSMDSNKNLIPEKSKVFSWNCRKPVEEIVHSETKLEQVVCLYQKPSKTTDSPSTVFIQEAKDSLNTSKRSLFEHKGACSLKSSFCPLSLLSGGVQMPKSTATSTMVFHLETNSNSESHFDNILSSEGSHFVPSLVTNCVDDILKTEESSRTCPSSISNCESADSTWQSSLDTDNNSHYQKKRMFSENKEKIKRMKTSEQINENICVGLERQTAFLEQVRYLIIYSINYELFDNKLKELNECTGKIECRNKHEGIADELFTKIAKLQRHIKTVLFSQRNCLEPNMLSSNGAYKISEKLHQEIPSILSLLKL
uniref:ATF7-interacting protein protein binding domain-containing protein n=1 Tax=Rhinopithecus roxellana TaxID=61622 RepID=A0A2K6NNT8_RHIRO